MVITNPELFKVSPADHLEAQFQQMKQEGAKICLHCKRPRKEHIPVGKGQWSFGEALICYPSIFVEDTSSDRELD